MGVSAMDTEVNEKAVLAGKPPRRKLRFQQKPWDKGRPRNVVRSLQFLQRRILIPAMLAGGPPAPVRGGPGALRPSLMSMHGEVGRGAKATKRP